LGWQAGYNLTTGDNNIDIGYDVRGVAGESNTIRIGNPSHLNTYVSGIYEQTVAFGLSVFVNSSGRLGTSTSSARFKEEIKPMDQASETLFALKPVTFRYKKQIDRQGIPQFGLVAEDVEKVDPNLVVRDKEGRPYSVRYDQVNSMVLNEFLKEHEKVQEQQATIADLKEAIVRLMARDEELAAKLQKVSAQMEMSQPTSRTAQNNR